MPSTKKPVRSESLRTSFLLADDIRVEVGGKLTAIGIYTDRTLIASIDRDEFSARPNDRGEKRTMAVGNLSAAFTIGGLDKGTHEVLITYDDPTMGSPEPLKVRETVVAIDSPNQAFNLIGRFSPFVTAGFGVKKFNVLIDGMLHVYTFEIRSAEEKSIPVEFIENPVSQADPQPKKKSRDGQKQIGGAKPVKSKRKVLSSSR